MSYVKNEPMITKIAREIEVSKQAYNRNMAIWMAHIGHALFLQFPVFTVTDSYLSIFLILMKKW